MVDYKKEETAEIKPSKIIRELLPLKKIGTVLDLGCGEGRNTLFISMQGFEVTGVDISSSAIEKLEKKAKELNLSIKTKIEDINKYPFDNPFDIIISTSTLHFLTEKEAKEVINKIKNNTKREGINLITIFTEDNPFKGFPYLFKKGELKTFYENWEILSYEEYITPLEIHNGSKPHRHGIASIIAKKLK